MKTQVSRPSVLSFYLYYTPSSSFPLDVPTRSWELHPDLEHNYKSGGNSKVTSSSNKGGSVSDPTRTGSASRFRSSSTSPSGGPTTECTHSTRLSLCRCRGRQNVSERLSLSFYQRRSEDGKFRGHLRRAPGTIVFWYVTSLSNLRIKVGSIRFFRDRYPNRLGVRYVPFRTDTFPTESFILVSFLLVSYFWTTPLIPL